MGECDFRALWFNMGEKEGYTISKGSTILRGLAELRLINQRRQTGLKWTLCGKASPTPFCQHLSCDFRSQAARISNLRLVYPLNMQHKWLFTLGTPGSKLMRLVVRFS